MNDSNLSRFRDINLKHVIIAVIITITLIVAAFFIGKIDNYNGYYIEPLRLSILLSFIGLILPKFKGKIINIIQAGITVLICIYLSYIALEMFNGNNLAEPFDGLEMMKIRLYINWGILFFYYLFFIVLFGSFQKGMTAGVIVLSIIGVACYAILEFRGQLLLPSDILALRTAVNVSESYQLPFRSNLAAPFFLIIAELIWIWRTKGLRFFEKKKVYYLTRLLGLLLVIGSVVFFYLQPFERAYYPWFIPNNGYLFSVAMNIKMLTIIPDASYSEETVKDLLLNTPESTILDSSYDPEQAIREAFPNYTGEGPNIICIMNESLTDFSVLGDIETSEEVFPYIKSLEETTIQGDLIVEVFGGGTSDSEYTFLTSNSTKLFADNTRAYEVYFSDETASVVQNLKEEGYRTYAIHPDKATNWNRDTVYPLLGFDEFITEEAFEGTEVIRDLYTSDRAVYEQIEEIYEEDPEVPLFMFAITMQNHGAYNQSYNNLDRIELISPDGELYPDVEQFLSLAKESDTAFKELIEFFGEADEPTVVLMFGDHQPKLDEGFYESFRSGEMSLEELRKEYTTPFILWANYDLPEDTIEEISINYLSTLLTEVSGTGRSLYHNYLAHLYHQFPVIDRRGVMTVDGESLYFDQLDSWETESVTEYNNVIYDNIFTDSINKEIYTTWRK